MAEVKLNILISGITSDSSSLFVSLYNYLKTYGHEVWFTIPEYSGAVSLIERKIPFIKLKQIKNGNNLGYDESKLLEKCLYYNLKQMTLFSSITKGIKTKQILKDGSRLFNAYSKYLDDNKVDLIILWGGIRYYSSIPAAIAKIKNIKCIFIEKGLFPFTLQVDDMGVNASSQLKNTFGSISSSLLSHSLDFYQSQLKQQWYFTQPLNNISSLIKIKCLINDYGLLELFVKIFHKYFDTKLLKKFNYKDNWKVTDPVSTSESIVHKDYIFIPFQVSDDSQLLVQGNWIKNNISLVESVWRSLIELGLKIKIVVKEHPREYITDSFTEKLSKYDVLYSNAGTAELIQKSKLIVTINSTVGFEALVFNKPVIITGNAFYESIPFILKSNNQAELTSNLKRVLMSNRNFEEREVNKYVSTVYNKLVKCNYVSPEKTEIDNLWQYIYNLHTTNI
ncbi:MAG: hypothetical protein WAU11_03475 [Ignavibacteriaceae bacterium]